jgi:prepilin-type N-terminal cleavage/methylation domain-containing protein
MKPFLRPKNAGFSLIELLIALVLSGIVVAAVYGIFISQNRSYVNQNRTAEMQQNARIAMTILLGEFRMGGFGFSINGDYSLAGGTGYAVTPTNSSTGPDSVTIRYGTSANPATPATLTAAMANSNSGIVLAVSSTAGFSANDFIIISDGQNAACLQISGTPGATTIPYTMVSPNIFPTGGFGVGSRVYKLRQVTYRVSNTILQSQTDGGAWQDVVNNIEDLQLGYQGTATAAGTWLDNPSPVDRTTLTDVQVNIIARSNEIDPGYTGQRPLVRDHSAGTSDHFRRRVLTSSIRIRNL